MPEIAEPIVTPVAPATPAAAPAAAPVAPANTASLMNELDTLIAPPKPTKSPETPAKPIAPAAKPDKVEPAKPIVAAPKAEPVKEKDPAALRKRLGEIEAEYSGYKLTTSQEQEKLQKQIKAYEKLPMPTEAQQVELQKKYDQSEQNRRALESELYAIDYSRSPEYADKYQKKWQAAYKSAVQRAKGASVEIENSETGEKSVRRASDADFERVRLAPPTEQLELAEKLFGKYAYIVMQDINGLASIEQSANEEVNARSKDYHERVAQAKGEIEKQSKDFQSEMARADSELIQKHPDIFGEESASPEISAAIKKSLATYDNMVQKARGTPQTPEAVKERAQQSATVRRMVGAYTRFYLENAELKTQIVAKDEELAKYRQSDPGGGSEITPTPIKSDGPQNTADLVAELDKKLDT